MVRFDVAQEQKVTDETTFEEWKRLNDAVRGVFHRFEWNTEKKRSLLQFDEDFQGVVSQRVVVRDPKALVPELLRSLSLEINRLGLVGAQVEVVFDFSGVEGVSHESLRGLLIAHAGGVDQAVFSLTDLRHHLGSQFYAD